MNKTNIEKVREIAIDFLHLEPTVVESYPVFVEHPFFDSRVVMTKEKTIVDIIDNPDELEKAVKIREDALKRSDLPHMFNMIRDKYHMAFLKYIKPYLSKTDFDEYLAFVWVNSENPNQDANVAIPQLIQWFKKANKRTLMDKDELAYYEQLPEIVDIYRGIAVGRAETEGLSWTCKYKTAEWFSNRYNTDTEHGYIVKGKIKKENIFAYFNSRNEDEILCDSTKVYDVERI